MAFLVCKEYSPIEAASQARPIAFDVVPLAWTPPTLASTADRRAWLEVDLVVHALNVAAGNLGAGNRVEMIWVRSTPDRSFWSTTLLRDPVYADMVSRASPLWRLSRDEAGNFYGMNTALI